MIKSSDDIRYSQNVFWIYLLLTLLKGDERNKEANDNNIVCQAYMYQILIVKLPLLLIS